MTGIPMPEDRRLRPIRPARATAAPRPADRPPPDARLREHRLAARGGLALAFMPHGATWRSLTVPLPGGARRELLLAREHAADHLRETAAFLGCTIGRYANRIAHGRIEHAGRTATLTRRPGQPHTLHGGAEGFDARVWQLVDATADRQRWRLDSPDGDQGFPGAAQIGLEVRLVDRLVLEMAYFARVTAASPVCLTQHAFFNLNERAVDVRTHQMRIAAARYAPVDDTLIPLGPLEPVDGGAFDFRHLRPIVREAGAGPASPQAGAYDHAFLLDEACAGARAPAVVLRSSDQRVQMTLETTLPAVQVYGGLGLAGIRGRGGHRYGAYAGIALEPEFLPDSPHHAPWPQPSCWLQPGALYQHLIRYRLETQ
jgi:aldose 1-epimerase